MGGCLSQDFKCLVLYGLKWGNVNELWRQGLRSWRYPLQLAKKKKINASWGILSVKMGVGGGGDKFFLGTWEKKTLPNMNSRITSSENLPAKFGRTLILGTSFLSKHDLCSSTIWNNLLVRSAKRPSSRRILLLSVTFTCSAKYVYKEMRIQHWCEVIGSLS